MSKLNLDISKLIIKAFDKVFEDILGGKYHRIVMKGGRNSTKSSIITLAIIIGVLFFKCDAICMVKYNNKVYDRLVSTFIEMLQRSGLYGFFGQYNSTRQEIPLLDSWNGRPTQHVIKFSGVDDPNRLKSFKPKSGTGGFRFIWFEELTDFLSLKEVTNVINTMGRGEGIHTTIMSYNPPKSTSNWVNKEYNSPCGIVLGHDNNNYVTEFTVKYTDENGDEQSEIVKQLVNHSTYLDVIASGHADWVKTTLIEAELTKQGNMEQYRWEYLGEAIGTQGNVFHNIHELNTTDFPNSIIYRGLDFGFTTDPSAYVEWSYDSKERKIYLVNEYFAKGVANDTLKYNINKLNKANGVIWADSQDPRTINELAKLGLRISGCAKGPDSVRHGIDWLQKLNGIYINPITCPNSYQEFKCYEYALDKLGEYTGELRDKDNHSIDATRYSLNVLM